MGPLFQTWVAKLGSGAFALRTSRISFTWLPTNVCVYHILLVDVWVVSRRAAVNNAALTECARESPSLSSGSRNRIAGSCADFMFSFILTRFETFYLAVFSFQQCTKLVLASDLGRHVVSSWKASQRGSELSQVGLSPFLVLGVKPGNHVCELLLCY